MSDAAALQEQGVRLFKQKDYEEAMRVFHEAQQAFEEAANPGMVAEMRVNIGLVHRALGEQQQALDEMTAALSYFDGASDTRRSAMVLGNMGGVYAALGDNDQAYTCYRRAADAFDALGETKLHGETLVAMGGLQVKEGKLTAGAASYEVGLGELEKLTPQQRILKGLIGVRNKMTGGQ